jgi:hypothetical protein
VSRFPIIDRIDAALATVAEQKMDVRAIYLTTEDRDAFDRAMRAKWKRKIILFDYEGHEIRRGETSRIYSTHGVGVAIPKSLMAAA